MRRWQILVAHMLVSGVKGVRIIIILVKQNSNPEQNISLAWSGLMVIDYW